jgi:hypothetical protein
LPHAHTHTHSSSSFHQWRRRGRHHRLQLLPPRQLQRQPPLQGGRRLLRLCGRRNVRHRPLRQAGHGCGGHRPRFQLVDGRRGRCSGYVRREMERWETREWR